MKTTKTTKTTPKGVPSHPLLPTPAPATGMKRVMQEQRLREAHNKRIRGK